MDSEPQCRRTVAVKRMEPFVTDRSSPFVSVTGQVFKLSWGYVALCQQYLEVIHTLQYFFSASI